MKHRRSPRTTHRHQPTSPVTRLGVWFEPLERRQLLAVASPVSAFRPPVPPTFTPTSQSVADVKNGPMAPAGKALIDIYREYRAFRNAGGADADFESEKLEQILHKETKIAVTVRGRGTLDQLTSRLREAKADWIRRNARWSTIDAFVPIALLHELARDPQIASINPMYSGIPAQQGSANNQADFVMKSDRIRDNFGLDGSGQKIGVLSDSVDRVGSGIAASIATGDLPSRGVEVISDSPILPGLIISDEGRAMLELIHDIAPGADLAFATANFGIQTFADYIRGLRAIGSTVIVDDIQFLTESFFQPSVVDQAIADVVADGAVYLSSAGNSGAFGGYEAPTNFTKVGRHRFVDFDPGPGADTRLRVQVTAGGNTFLQWDEPYNGVVGQAQTDIDIFIYDTQGRLVSSGVTNNIRTGIPLEAFSLPAGELDIEIRVFDKKESAPFPTRFRLTGFGGVVFDETEYEPEGKATIFGHNGGPSTISVGAAPFFQPTENEDFSSVGPVTHLFDAGGNRLNGPVTLLKPDISGVDFVNTSFFPTPTPAFPFSPNTNDINQDDDVLSNFSGTSAAAPNVAAAVALMRQAAPQASQIEILDALMFTAHPLNGADSGYDPQGGFGLVDAEQAIQQFIAAPQVHIEAVSPDPRVDPIDNIKIVFSQKVLGFEITDLTFRRDNGPNLLGFDQSLETTDNGRTWLLRGLRDVTSTPGGYVLRLNHQGTDIVNASIFFTPLANSATERFSVIPFPPIPATPTDLRAKFVTQGEVRLRWTDNSDNEDRFLIERADDEGFGVNRRSFTVTRNVTVFTDKTNGLDGGKRVFYRVRAINDFSEFQGTSNIAVLSLPMPGEIFLDSIAGPRVQISGAWSQVEDDFAFGGSFLIDDNSGKGTKTVRFGPNIPQTQEYFVYAKWTRASDRATNVPYDVGFANGRQTVVLDQRNNGGDGWVLLGKFLFEKGTSGFVRVRTDGTNGVVSVDGIRFLPALGAT